MFSPIALYLRSIAVPPWQAAPYTTAGGGVVSFDSPCDYFTVGSAKATTLSLTVIVAIEMLNSYNALSEDNSLLKVGSRRQARIPSANASAAVHRRHWLHDQRTYRRPALVPLR